MILLDATSSGGYTGTTTLTVAHTVGTGSNRILVVGTSVQDANHNSYPVTGITYAGVALIKIRSDEAVGNNRTEIWYLLNPTSGTNNIIMTTTGSLDKALVGVSFTGVAQGGIPDAQAGVVGTSTSSALNLTTILDSAWTFHIVSTEASISSVSNGTEVGPITGQSFENAAGTYQGSLTPPGVYGTTFNFGSNQSFAHSAISLPPASGGSVGFPVAPTADYVSTTLNGAITTTATTITLTSTANLQSKGYLIIDRIDASGNQTPSNREFISYTGISGNNLTGVTRAADNSTARLHADQAVVETIAEIGFWNSLTTIAASAFDTQGLLRSIVSPVSIVQAQVNTLYTSIASIGTVKILSRLDVSSASITGLGFVPIFQGGGSYSGPTTAIGGLLIAPRTGTLQYVTVVTKYVASGTSVGFNFLVRGQSVFANATTYPAIAAGGTFVSTASIATPNINAGDLIQADVDSMLAGAGLIQEVTVQGGTF
jgi:hypothetical protein